MKRAALAFTLLGCAFAPLSSLSLPPAHASSLSSPSAQGCKATSNGYVHSQTKCVHIPSHGEFSLHVPGTAVELEGTGTGKTAGTEVDVTQVPQPCPSMHGVGVRVDADGSFPPLKPKKGKAYLFDPATGQCSLVNGIKHPGIYEVVGA